MQLTFGNMTLELNIFHLGKRHMNSEGGEFEEVCILETILEEQGKEQQIQDVLTAELSECCVKQHEHQEVSLMQGYWRRRIEIFRLKIFQVGKFSTSWSLTKLLDFGTHT